MPNSSGYGKYGNMAKAEAHSVLFGMIYVLSYVLCGQSGKAESFKSQHKH
jgi:hypothetical protein